jgi:hypothetical protein
MQVYAKKIHTLKLKIRKHKIIIRRGSLPGTLVSLICCLNHLNSASSTSLQASDCFSFTLSVPFKHTNSFGYVFQMVWVVEFTRPNSQHTSALFSLFPFAVSLTFPSTLKIFLLFITLSLSSCHQSPVNCSGRYVESNFTHKVNYRYYCNFPGLEFM